MSPYTEVAAAISFPAPTWNQVHRNEYKNEHKSEH